MPTIISDASKPLSLLSSIYLCKPLKEAIKNWRVLLSEDTTISLQGLKDAIRKIDTDSDGELKDLLWDYTRLFIGPYKLPCPPWESVYTSPKRLMMQEAAAEVQNIYRGAGLIINSKDIMPDHIGTELNFLSILLQRINTDGGGATNYIKIAEKFLNEHLLKWVPQFTLDMEEAAASPLYKTLAHLTREFIINECNFFG
jgi:TorA maturation chaperone TorD